MAASLSKLFLGAPSAHTGSIHLPSQNSYLLASRSQHKLHAIQASSSTFGSYFCVTTFGESLGRCLGCVIDGCPPGIPLSEADIQVDTNMRRSGLSRITTPRKETDTCKITSGIAGGLTTGAPIKIEVPNTDQRGHDFGEMSLAYGKSHADATYNLKYRGRLKQCGMGSSARETIGRIAAGSVAKKVLKLYCGTEVLAYVSQVGKVVLPECLVDHETMTLDQIESSIVRCPNPEYAEKMIAAIDAVRVRGDSTGVVVTCIARNVPRGLGSPVSGKLNVELGTALMSLSAARRFEYGSGFAGALLTGSEHMDDFYVDDSGQIRTKANLSGGIQGGISNGQIINMRISFNPSLFQARGHRDPCVVPRAVTIVQALAELVLVDQLMAVCILD